MLQVDALHHSTGLGQQHHLELLAPHAGRNIILSFVMSPVFRIHIHFFPDPDPEVEARDQYQQKKTFNFQYGGSGMFIPDPDFYPYRIQKRQKIT
jgi:hypothetical protein